MTFQAAITKNYHQKREEFKTVTGREVNQKEITDSESLINTVLKDIMTLHIIDCKIRKCIYCLLTGKGTAPQGYLPMRLKERYIKLSLMMG